MGKYTNAAPLVTKPKSPTRTVGQSGHTYEGGIGYVRDAKSELFVLAVSFMGEGENTFYETSSERHARFVGLVQKVSADDPEWMLGFVGFLRDSAQMRTASVVAGVEAARTVKGSMGRAILARSMSRADEPAEALGYQLHKYGRKIPGAVKNGIADGATKLYNQFSVHKYDGTGHGIRMGDVIELTHPKPVDSEQSAVFEYALDRKGHPDSIRANMEDLEQVALWRRLQSIPREGRRDYLRKNPGVLREAGMTWEVLSEWLPGGMDAEAWEAIIPSMGYMALLRNLNNFDKAGVSAKVKAQVAARLADPEQVAKSRQFPYRFVSALKATETFEWASALEKGLDASVSNVPLLKGRTLVMIDLSGSMGWHPISEKSKLFPWEAAAIFGVAQYLRAGAGDLVAWASTSTTIALPKSASVLRGVEAVRNVYNSGVVGGGTNLWSAINAHYDGHDRIMVFTDQQSTGLGRYAYTGNIEGKVPLYFWNLQGYRRAATSIDSEKLTYEFGGLTDATFRQIALIEQGRDAKWPWEQ